MAINHSTSISPVNSSSTLPAEWQMLQQQAAALVASGFLPQAVNTPQKAVAIMMLGRELGIQPWAALTTINVIQQKPTVSPQLMLALISRSGQLEDMTVDATDQGCTVTMERKGRTPHTEVFDLADVNAMQLSGKDNYKKQPATMMKWRAVAACARVVFADVILGLYTPEEMGAEVIADEQGNMTVIDVKPEPVRQTQAPQEQLPAPSRPATVSGAGLPVTQPPVVVTEPNPLDWTEEEPKSPGVNLIDVLNAASAEKLVRSKAQFDGVIADFKANGTIKDTSTDTEILEAVRKWFHHKEGLGQMYADAQMEAREMERD